MPFVAVIIVVVVAVVGVGSGGVLSLAAYSTRLGTVVVHERLVPSTSCVTIFHEKLAEVETVEAA